jgi:hypothetical protein
VPAGKADEKKEVVTSDLAPEEKVVAGQVCFQGLEGEVEAGALLNVQGASVCALNVFEFLRQFRNFHLNFNLLISII